MDFGSVQDYGWRDVVDVPVWTQGEAVWSLAIWQEDARVVAAGTAGGVYLSRDAGESWQRISPESNRELRPVVSLAKDPTNQEIVYAGTTHLPWRTAARAHIPSNC